MKDYARRLEIIETAKRIVDLDASARYGQHAVVSIRTKDGMLITPATVQLDALTPDDLVSVSVSSEAGGRWAPASEWLTHRDLYANRPELNAIVQAQPVHAAALACMGKAIPPFHYLVALAGGKDIRCALYATFGSQRMADSVVHAFRERRGCLVAHHGLVAGGESAAHAFALACEIEHLSQMYLLASRNGEPPYLADEEMKRVVLKFMGGTIKPGAF